MLTLKRSGAGSTSPAHVTFNKHTLSLGLGASFLSGAVLWFNGSYGYHEGGWCWVAAFLGFAVLKDSAISYAWAARGEYGRVAAAILGVIAFLISCLAAIGAASTGKQEASDPKAQAIERYNSAQRQQQKIEARLAELGRVPNAAEAKAAASDLLSKIEPSIAKRTKSCVDLAPKSNGPRQIAVNREACQPYIDAQAVIAKADEAAVLRNKLEVAEGVLAEGKPASADAQATTLAAILGLFTALQGISGIQAWTSLFLGLGLEISSPLAWAAYASAKQGHARPAMSTFSPSNEAQKINIASADSEQSDFPAVTEASFGALKAVILGEQPNGPTAEIVNFPVPNGSPNGPRGPKPGKRARTVKEAALADLQGRIASGERFESQDELKARYGVAKSTMSDWLGEWEAAGLIPPRLTVGRRKEVAAG